MRRRLLLVLVILCGLVPLAASPVIAQDTPAWEFGAPNTLWEGVSRPEPPATEAALPPPLSLQTMQPYAVRFDTDYASVPAITSQPTEFLVIVVREGQFAIDSTPPAGVTLTGTETGIVIYPAGSQPIPLMEPVMEGGAWVAPYYQVVPNSHLQISPDVDCLAACPLPPNTIAQANVGDIIVTQPGAICVYCLLNQNFDALTPATATDDQGLLDVFALVSASGAMDPDEDFSWIKAWESSQGVPHDTVLRDTIPAMTGDADSLIRGWAYLNPHPGCHRGPG